MPGSANIQLVAAKLPSLLTICQRGSIMERRDFLEHDRFTLKRIRR